MKLLQTRFILGICLLIPHLGKTQSMNVIATTSWTAAYAYAAGAEKVELLAPYEMIHPSEYELKPGDLKRINQAQLVLYGGYEVMMGRLEETLKLHPEYLIRLTTNYRYTDIEKNVLEIAQRMGTVEKAKINLAKIKKLFSEGRESVNKQHIGEHVFAIHFFQVDFLREIGIEPAIIFGPAPLEPRQMMEIAQKHPEMIVDNIHNPVGASLPEIVKGSEVIELINFPGYAGTRKLEDVIQYNLEHLLKKHQR